MTTRNDTLRLGNDWETIAGCLRDPATGENRLDLRCLVRGAAAAIRRLGVGAVRGVERSLTGLDRWLLTLRVAKELSALDDATLHDIGMHRSSLHNTARSLVDARRQ